MEKCLEYRLIQVNLDVLISGFFTVDDTDFGLRNSQNGSGCTRASICPSGRLSSVSVLAPG